MATKKQPARKTAAPAPIKATKEEVKIIEEVMTPPPQYKRKPQQTKNAVQRKKPDVGYMLQVKGVHTTEEQVAHTLITLHVAGKLKDKAQVFDPRDVPTVMSDMQLNVKEPRDGMLRISEMVLHGTVVLDGEA